MVLSIYSLGNQGDTVTVVDGKLTLLGEIEKCFARYEAMGDVLARGGLAALSDDREDFYKRFLRNPNVDPQKKILLGFMMPRVYVSKRDRTDVRNSLFQCDSTALRRVLCGISEGPIVVEQEDPRFENDSLEEVVDLALLQERLTEIAEPHISLGQARNLVDTSAITRSTNVFPRDAVVVDIYRSGLNGSIVSGRVSDLL